MKHHLLTLLLLPLLMGADSRAPQAVVNDFPQNRFNCIVSNVTANTQCAGASGAGLSYYLTSVILANGATAQNLQIVSSTTAGTACITSPVNVTPLLFGAINTTMPTLIFPVPIKITANSALCCTRSGATAFSCMLSGFIAP